MIRARKIMKKCVQASGLQICSLLIAMLFVSTSVPKVNSFWAELLPLGPLL
jgi:hypothetical protein